MGWMHRSTVGSSSAGGQLMSRALPHKARGLDAFYRDLDEICHLKPSIWWMPEGADPH